jgi:hypothetical protein
MRTMDNFDVFLENLQSVCGEESSIIKGNLMSIFESDINMGKSIDKPDELILTLMSAIDDIFNEISINIRSGIRDEGLF